MTHLESTSLDLLKLHGLRKTPCRLAVLELFFRERAALSHQNIEQQTQNSNFDRVTIYRTLTTFEEKGILHRVPDLEGQAKYALCSEKCSEHAHHDAHVHFKCQTCEKVLCMEDIPLPETAAPKGYQVKTASFLLEGLCAECNG
ncbi:MAG: transcriptional repressor [Bernardetiaceae bacterium]|nr:transcriptional repressor [Bernardetiaceae bacterium]